ncbi:MAG: sterol desaturase family protein [Alphaproteobacteria bacterium]|nr:sterol desaturase family protein [Alphaproteobacteria bacterium]
MEQAQERENTLKYAISWIAWPGLFAGCMAITAFGYVHGQPILFFNIAYILLILTLFGLELYMPHEKEWQKSDGQVAADLLHTLSSKGTVQLLLLFSGIIGLTSLMEDPQYGIWPREWPLWAQVCLGVVAAEFPLYWAHRLGHEWPFMWRFHAVHHSVEKLWIVNTGRFHFIDSLIKIIVSMAILLALGAPLAVVKWLTAITAFVGMLTHCNVEMRFGWLSWIFNTPELHRWHHSMDLREGDKNYCENMMLWDHVFGTYFRESHRRPPVDIGIKDFMPPKFRHQIIWPFLSKSQKARIEQSYT